MKPFRAALALCLLLSACEYKKAELIEEIVPEPVITISDPAPGGIYAAGDSLVVKATAISAAILHGFDLAFYRAGSTTPLSFTHIHDHNDTIRIDQKWKPEATGALEAEISVYIDHDGHSRKARVAFLVQ
jgi:hypothetical protein